MKFHGIIKPPTSFAVARASVVRWWGARLQHRFGANSPIKLIGHRQSYVGPATPDDQLPDVFPRLTGADEPLKKHQFFDVQEKFLNELEPVAKTMSGKSHDEFIWQAANFVGVASPRGSGGFIYAGLWETSDPVLLSYLIRRPKHSGGFEYLNATLVDFGNREEASPVPGDLRISDELSAPNQWELL